MTRILVIHGAGEPAMQRGAVYWKAKLEDALGAGFEVSAPIMPRPDEPRYDTWRGKIEECVAGVEDNLILLGHSLGGSVLLKTLSQGRLNRSIAGLFILAAPYWGKESGWESDEFGLPADLAARLRPHPSSSITAAMTKKYPSAICPFMRKGCRRRLSARSRAKATSFVGATPQS